MSWRKGALALTVAVLLLAACSDEDQVASEPEPTRGGTVTLLTHDSFAVSEEVFDTFTERTGLEVDLIQGGDAGEVTNAAILAAGNPQADVLFGVDSTLLSRALDADLFAEHTAERLDAVGDAYQPSDDARDRVTPIDHGDVCVNADRSWFEERELEPPTTLADLTDPAYAGQLVVQNPATSSPGLAFLLATVAEFGDGWQDYWRDLVDADVAVAAGWEDAYYGRFSGAAGSEGERPLVVSYASSPAAEVVFAESEPEVAPTIALPETCYRQVEYAGVLRGTDQPDAAGQLVDFMLSDAFQQDIPLQMFVYPVVDDVPLPEVFVEHAEQVQDAAVLPPSQVQANREQWLQTWTDIVQR